LKLGAESLLGTGNLELGAESLELRTWELGAESLELGASL